MGNTGTIENTASNNKNTQNNNYVNNNNNNASSIYNTPYNGGTLNNSPSVTLKSANTQLNVDEAATLLK